MVWGLFPVDQLPGETGHYIFKKGVYQVGRKGCDIIVNKGNGVSRVHAEIIVEELVCMDHSSRKQLSNSSKVRIRDCSKYGTFITEHIAGSTEKVHEFPNKETVLIDGNLLIFGTGNERYKFSYVPLVFFTSLCKPSSVNKLREMVSLIGASVTKKWSSQCTHVICDDVIPFNDVIRDAILAREELVKISWIETIAEITVCTEIPSVILHTPNLIFEGVTLCVTDPKSREKCLEGYTFVLESTKTYKFKEKLQLFLELASAKVVCVETQDSISEGNTVFVIPVNNNVRAESYSNFTSLPKVVETDLIMAVISGHLDLSIIVSAPVMVTTSGSSDETVVAESEEELENFASKSGFSKATNQCDVIVTESINNEQGKVSRGGCVIVKDISNASECSNADVIVSQDLIIRHGSSEDLTTTNYKRFRKTNTPSGNSFTNLIPFAKHPYQETHIGSNDVVESYKEEKKRKQMEVMSEDLFNYERRKPASSGSILQYLARH